MLWGINVILSVITVPYCLLSRLVFLCQYGTQLFHMPLTGVTWEDIAITLSLNKFIFILKFCFKIQFPNKKLASWHGVQETHTRPLFQWDAYLYYLTREASSSLHKSKAVYTLLWDPLILWFNNCWNDKEEFLKVAIEWTFSGYKLDLKATSKSIRTWHQDHELPPSGLMQIH